MLGGSSNASPDTSEVESAVVDEVRANFSAAVDDVFFVKFKNVQDETVVEIPKLSLNGPSVKYNVSLGMSYNAAFDREEGLEARLAERTKAIKSSFADFVDDVRQRWLAKESSRGSRASEGELSTDDLLGKDASQFLDKVKDVIFGSSAVKMEAVSLSYENVNYAVPKQKSVPEFMSGPRTMRTACLGALVGVFYACKPSEDDSEVKILRDISGVFCSGETTLILGPAGCGKTSLMRVLSGRERSQYVTGSIKYNGVDADDIAATKFATFVSQLDSHFARLTVNETLQFALDCRGDVANEIIARFKEEYGQGMEDEEAFRTIMEKRVDFVLKFLGLSRVAESVVGDASLRGISGGEKRRLTLGEQLVVGAKILFLDEISTGLDSAATQDIVYYICQLCKTLEHTGVISLLQPPPEVYDLFDNVIFMADGFVVYHGRRVDALKYFEGLGFKHPETLPPSEFLQEIVRSEEARSRYWRQGPEAASKLALTSEDLAKAFANSDNYTQMMSRATELDRSNTSGTQQTEMKNLYKKKFTKLLHVVTTRQGKLYFRDSAFIVSRVVQNIIMGLLIGLLTFQTPIEDYYVKVMVLYTTLLFVGFGSVALLPQVLVSREIWYKQHVEGFYPPGVHALAEQFVGLFTIVLDSLVLGNLVYWMTGFTASDNGSHFFVFLLVLFLYGLMVSNLMRLCGYLFPDSTTASAVFMCLILVMVLFSGAIATREALPDFYIWLYWVNPTTWAYNSLVQNEFKSGTYLNPPATNLTTGACVLVDPPADVNCAIFFLNARQFPTQDLLWWGILYLLVWCVGLVGLQVLVLSKVDYSRRVPAAAATVVKHRKEFKRPGSRREDISDAPADSSPFFEDSITRSTIVFKDLGYHVEISARGKEPAGGGDSGSSGGLRAKQYHKLQRLDILKAINGFFKPGEMTALMGSSGAGKSTLMDVIAGRKTTGIVTGTIMLNGHEVNWKTFARKIGYVEQFGIHLEQSTVRESLLFSVAMRLGYTVSNAKRETLCDSVLKALELKSIENKLVGNATTGLSFEEIKRLTIAVELVANPAILFADEPTSGLEAHAALTVMRVLRRLADSGRTVVATVHQPNEEIFNMFDRLLLLKRGGEVVYFDKIGTNSKQLLSYFQAIPGVEPCGKAINPATWMLNVIGAGTQTTETNAKDFAGIYRSSSIYTDTLRTISQLASKEAADNTIHCENNDPKQQREGKVVDAIGASTSHATVKSDAACEETVFAVGFPAQVALLSRRNFLEYYRTPGYSLYRVLIVTGLSIVAGLIFVGGKLRDASDVQSIISSISVIVTVAGNYNVGTIIPFMYEHKALFYRERASNTYSAEAFAVAANLVEDPFILLQALCTVIGFYFIAGLVLSPAWVFFYFLVMFWIFLMLYTFVGLLISTLLPNVGSAQIVATIFTQLSTLFSGISIPGNRIPGYLIWLYYLSPMRWVMEGFIMTQFQFVEDPICNPFGTPVQVGMNATCVGENNSSIPSTIVGSASFCCPTGTRAQSARDFVFNDFLVLVRGIGLGTTSLVSYNRR